MGFIIFLDQKTNNITTSCGICGDPLCQPQPRDHETGGRFSPGVIVKTYFQNQVQTSWNIGKFQNTFWSK